MRVELRLTPTLPGRPAGTIWEMQVPSSGFGGICRNAKAPLVSDAVLLQLAIEGGFTDSKHFCRH